MNEASGRLDRFLILVLWLGYVLAGMHTTIATDTARDLIAAWDIVQGTNFPLRGPELYTTWTLGPIWYYLLALPLALTHSAAVAALMIAALAGLKFPLAYRLGTELGGVTLGRYSLLAIAMPGWWLFEWLVTSHTNLAVPCLLGYALWLLRWVRTDGAVSVWLAGLLFSLSVHAHPTSLFWAWLWVPAIWARYVQRPVLPWTQLLGAVGMFLLPFLPMLIDEAATGWPMLAGTRDFVATRGGPSLLSRLLPFLHDVIAIDGTRMPGQFLIDSVMVRSGVVIGLAVLWAASLVGYFAFAKGWTVRLSALLSFVAASVFVLWLRPEVPYWMVYALAPGIAAALAFGWQGLDLLLPQPRRSLFGAILAGLVSTIFLLLVSSRWISADEGWVNVPYRVVGRYADPNKRVDKTLPNAAYPVAGQERWVRWLCAQSLPISLHGDAATMQRMTQGVLHDLHCPGDDHWRIGGAAGKGIALYPRFAISAIGATPTQLFGAMAQLPVVEVLRAADAQTDSLVRAYPPWPLTQQSQQAFTVAIDTKVVGVIAVTNLRVVYNGLETPELVVDGATIAPLARTASTWFFLVPAHLKGELSVRSGDVRWIEVLQIDHGQ